MYEMRNLKTGQVYRRASLEAIMKLRNKVDREYGAVCTTYPRLVEVQS